MARAVGRVEIESGRGGAPQASVGALVAWVLTTALLGTALWWLDGAPWQAWQGWDWERLRTTLGGSRLTESDIVLIATTIAWLALAYLALTLALRVLVGLADALTGGTAWTRTALTLTNLVTLPAVRRAVDGAVAGTLLVTSWLPATHRVAAAADVRASAVVTTPLPYALPSGQPGEQRSVEPALQPTAHAIEYTVAPGDYLWDIARRVYGDGSRYIDIFELNRDRVMTNGERFTDPRLIRTGWVLDIPLPAANLSVVDDTVRYRVRRGDHLWGIAERFLGDGFRWVEIWERNGGGEMVGGSRFTDPNLIHPGWVLELPLPVSEPWTVAPEPIAPAEAPVESATLTAGPPPLQPPADSVDRPPFASHESSGGWSIDWPSLPREVLVTTAGFAVIGGTALFVRRLAQSGMLTLPAHGGRRHDTAGDAGRVSLATRALAAALADHGFAESVPLIVIESERRLDFTVACPPGDGEALTAASHDLARRLACEVAAEVAGRTRVTVTLTGFQRLAAMLGDHSRLPIPLVVPVGADARGILYLNLASAGSVVISGQASERRQLLRSWIATLSTVLGPDELVLRIESEAARLLGEDAALPHVALADASDAADLAEELDELIESHGASDSGRPIVAIVDTANDKEDRLDGIRRYGPKVGVYVIACQEATMLDHDTFGASIAIGTTGSDVAEDEGGTPTDGGLRLAIGRDDSYALEPVHVRRDSSPRWKESAEVATFDRPFVSPPTEAAATEDAVEPHQRDSQAPPLAADATNDLEKVEEPAETIESDYESEETDASLVGGVIDQAGADAAAAPGADPDAQPELVDAKNVLPDAPAAGGRPGEERDPPASVGRKALAQEETEDDGGNPETQGDGSRVSPSTPDPIARHAEVVAHPSADSAARQGTLLPDSRSDDPTGIVFSVRCLGRFEVRLGETVVTCWSPEKSRELLAFLAAHGGDFVASEIAADALWPDYAWDEGMRHLISNAASGIRSALRKAAGKPDLQPLTLARQRLYLQRSLLRTDIDAVELTLRRAPSLPDPEALAEYERAFELYSGEFLEGELYTWASDYRNEHRQRILAAMRQAIEIAELLDESERALNLHRLILDREPTDEAAARGVMRHLAATGDGNAARKVYRELTESLQAELDDPRAAPGAETRALYAELIRGEAP